MVSKVWQLVISIAVVAIALGVGVLAAGLLDPSPRGPAGSPGATVRVSADPGVTTGPPDGSPGASAEETVVMIGAGDIADCSRVEDELTANLVESIEGIVFTAGDHADPDGALETFEECYGPTWGRPAIKDRTRPAPGDNDYDTPGAAGYFEYFGEAAGAPGAGYYAYDAGAWRVYVLNSNCGSIDGCGPGSPQETWLLEDLAAEPRECVLAIWHHPYFTSGPSEGGDSSRRNLWRILQEAGAELVVNGHDHHYERFAAQTADGEPDPNGIVQLIVGTGGSRPDDLRVHAPNSEARAFDVFGALRLELAPGGYAFEFIAVSGPSFTDSGTGECH